MMKQENLIFFSNWCLFDSTYSVYHRGTTETAAYNGELALVSLLLHTLVLMSKHIRNKRESGLSGRRCIGSIFLVSISELFEFVRRQKTGWRQIDTLIYHVP